MHDILLVVQLAACAEPDVFIERARRYFGEVPVAVGRTEQGGKMMTFASPQGTWLFAMTNADGQLCLHAAGTAYVQTGKGT